jgi:hypothetical protein
MMPTLFMGLNLTELNRQIYDGGQLEPDLIRSINFVS